MLNYIIIILLFILPFLVLTYGIYKSISIIKHDSVLYSFRELKGDMSLYLADNLYEPSKHAELVALRNMVSQLSLFIDNFEVTKIHLFRYKVFVKFILGAKKLSETLNESYKSESPEFTKFKMRMGHALFQAFFNLVPFLRFRIFALFFSFIIGFFVALGIKRFDKKLNIKMLYDNLSSQYSQYDDCAV